MQNPLVSRAKGTSVRGVDGRGTSVRGVDGRVNGMDCKTVNGMDCKTVDGMDCKTVDGMDCKTVNGSQRTYLKICAPMVRYSQLPFRELVRSYGTDLCYTPMILANVFKHSKISQQLEFRTSYADSPVIVQFAASNALDAADAAELVAKHCSGVDINCGCPQKWAINEGIGSALLKDPDLICDMIRQVKARTSSVKLIDSSPFPCSIKIRIDQDIKVTLELAKRAEKMGASWITVHGRTQKQRNTTPVNAEAIKIIKESLSIPVFFNGQVSSLAEADNFQALTSVDGVMSATGLLHNPALFAGYSSTPWAAVMEYMKHAINYGTTSFIFHHHLMFMRIKC